MTDTNHQRPASSDLTEGTTGIVIAGAGARGAYEAGVLSVLLPALEAQGRHPWLFVGTSAGAINAVLFASWAHRPAEEAAELALARWRGAGRAQVFNPVLSSMSNVTTRYAAQLAGFRVRLAHLLDTAPQRQTLERWLNWPILHANLQQTYPSTSVAVVTTACASGRTQVFVEGAAAGSVKHHQSKRKMQCNRPEIAISGQYRQLVTQGQLSDQAINSGAKRKPFGSAGTVKAGCFLIIGQTRFRQNIEGQEQNGEF